MFAAEYNWAGALTGDICDSTQWTPTATGIPTYSNSFFVTTTGANVSQSANTYMGKLVVYGSTTGAAPVLNLTHSLTLNNDVLAVGGNTWPDYPAAAGKGIINHTSGTVRDYNGFGPYICVGSGETANNSSGTYNFGGAPGSAPVITILNSSYGIFIGGGGGNTGVMSLTGYGTINNQGPIYIGTQDIWGGNNGNGTLNITGGNLAINASALYVGGHLSGSSIVAGGSIASLNVTIDSTGISAINATTVRIDSLAVFNANVSGVTPALGTVYTIISSTNPISGTFIDQPEGSYLQAGSNWFTISYLGNKVTLTVSAAPASLAAWVEEDFSYTQGSILDGQNGGTGFSAAWSPVEGGDGPATIVPALTYPSLVNPTGCGAIETHGYWRGNTRTCTSPHGGGTYYMSMLINAKGTETNRLGFGLVTSSGGYCQFGRVNGGWGMFAGGNGNFGVSNSGGNYHQWKGVTAAADSNTHLLVFKFNYTAQTIDMFVDPSVSAGEPSPSATLQTGTVDPSGTGSTWTISLGLPFTSVEWYDEWANQELGALRVGKLWESVVPPPPATFTNWLTNYPALSGSNALPGANPGHDGISNLMKYALGLDPTVSAQPAGTVSSGTLTFNKGSMAQGDSNIVYSIEESTDLVTWTTQTGASVTNGPTAISYTYPSGQTKVFARLKVMQTP